MPEGPSLDVSRLTASEREQLAKLVDELALNVDAQCPECLQWVARRTLREHIKECVTPVLRTRRLEVLDEDGAVAVVLGDLGCGQRGLALRDAFGADQLVITRDHGGAGLRFCVGGNEVASFGVDTDADPEREPGAYLMLASFNGVPVQSWGVTFDGQAISRLSVAEDEPTE